MDGRRPGKYLNLRLMEERIVDVADVYATWNVPHFVPIKDFAYFTLHHLQKHFSSVGHQGDGSPSCVPSGEGILGFTSTSHALLTLPEAVDFDNHQEIRGAKLRTSFQAAAARLLWA